MLDRIKTEFSDQITITVHKHEKLKGMIDIEGDNFYYTNIEGAGQGLQCEFEEGTKEHHQLKHALQSIIGGIRLINKI